MIVRHGVPIAKIEWRTEWLFIEYLIQILTVLKYAIIYHDPYLLAKTRNVLQNLYLKHIVI